MDSIGTWHHGLVADWWAEFNTAGPELDYFGHFIETGQPALDAGCGSGRLLLPWLRAGYDVDGCDVSADMISRCRDLADSEGLAPTLWVQALHDLAPPRRYATIVVCGVFGLGSTREQDKLALRRLNESLEPGGTLLIDNEAALCADQALALLDERGPGQASRAVATPRGTVSSVRRK